MKKTIYIFLVMVVLFTLTGCFKEENNTDALKFKKEYEELNGKKNSYNKKKYVSLKIENDNVIKYSNAEEIIKLLKDGTGVIYFGFPDCPWCRSAVPSLLEAAKETGIENVLYMNLGSERDTLTLDEDSNVVVEKKGSKDYYQLVEALDEILNDYELEDIYGNSVSTGTKRIYVPLVIFVSEGTIVGIHSDTVETQVDPYVPLDEKQKGELLDIYIDFMHKTLGDVCDKNC